MVNNTQIQETIQQLPRSLFQSRKWTQFTIDALEPTQYLDLLDHLANPARSLIDNGRMIAANSLSNAQRRVIASVGKRQTFNACNVRVRKRLQDAGLSEVSEECKLAEARMKACDLSCPCNVIGCPCCSGHIFARTAKKFHDFGCHWVLQNPCRHSVLMVTITPTDEHDEQYTPWVGHYSVAQVVSQELIRIAPHLSSANKDKLRGGYLTIELSPVDNDRNEITDHYGQDNLVRIARADYMAHLHGVLFVRDILDTPSIESLRERIERRLNYHHFRGDCVRVHLQHLATKEQVESRKRSSLKAIPTNFVSLAKAINYIQKSKVLVADYPTTRVIRGGLLGIKTDQAFGVAATTNSHTLRRNRSVQLIKKRIAELRDYQSQITGIRSSRLARKVMGALHSAIEAYEEWLELANELRNVEDNFKRGRSAQTLELLWDDYQTRYRLNPELFEDYLESCSHITTEFLRLYHRLTTFNLPVLIVRLVHAISLGYAFRKSDANERLHQYIAQLSKIMNLRQGLRSMGPDSSSRLKSIFKTNERLPAWVSTDRPGKLDDVGWLSYVSTLLLC